MFKKTVTIKKTVTVIEGGKTTVTTTETNGVDKDLMKEVEVIDAWMKEFDAFMKKMPKL